jgi:hemolysin activation/secretion protein
VDQRSAKTQGGFAKFEWAGRWSAPHLGPDHQFTFSAAAHGQFTSHNLDSSEKLTLGGPTGVRGYGPSEATGDVGYIANLAMAYRINSALGVSAFFDRGGITRNKSAWEPEGAIPERYSLNSGGVSVTGSWRSVDASVVFAQQIGANPGLNSHGVDADGSKDRSHVWLSLAGRF